MAIKKMTDLQKLSLDVYEGKVENYSLEDGENAIRNAIKEACGGEWNYYSFMDNKYKVFQVMAEVLAISNGALLNNAFDEFVEIRDTALGDEPEFIIEDHELFRVSVMANGTNDIRRQGIFQNRLALTTFDLGIKIYAEFDQFMAGRVNWARAVNKVALSFQNKIGEIIYNTIMNTYSGLVAPYQISGTFDPANLTEIIAHVEASTGKKAIIYGTKRALAKIPFSGNYYEYLSRDMKNELNQNGFLRMFDGTVCVELPQAHIPKISEFAVRDDFLLIVPNGEKIVKLVFEGEPFVNDVSGEIRNDRQIEYLFTRKVGIGILKANQYGIMKLS